MKSNARLAFGLGLLTVASASAYILPATSILRRLAEARDDAQLSNLRVDGALTFLGPSVQEAAQTLKMPEGAEVQVDSSLLLKVPGRCRLEAQASDGSKLAAVLSGGRRRTESQLPSPMWAAVEQICSTLAIRVSSSTEARAVLERYLQTLRVDMRTPWLSRLGGRVAFVLGKREDRSPQFWVYKDTFQPARIRWTDAQQTIWDVRWLDYGSPITADLFPRIVEVSRNGELALRFTGLKADSQTKISDRLF